MNYQILTKEECERAVEKYDPEINYIEVLESALFHRGLIEDV